MHFTDCFPSIPSRSEQFMLQGMTYKATLFIDDHIEMDNVKVQCWTSQCDKDNAQGDWHALDLMHISRDNNFHVFGQTNLVTSVQDFEFTFRAWDGFRWHWSNGYRCNGCVKVMPPRENDRWTQGPDYNLIIGSVHCGNFIAACQAEELGFTHVLNVADTLDIVLPLESRLTYHKVDMVDGGSNPIEAHKIQEAVNWLRCHDGPQNKILLNCRAGIGRAGSTVVAYVFALDARMSYEDAVKFCQQKRFIYPHAGLRETLNDLFPRKA